MVTIVRILSARMAGNSLDATMEIQSTTLQILVGIQQAIQNAVMENVKKERQINVFVLIIICNAKLLV
jgi:hypothetical protein|tara:strand:+ start:2796 stop:2999 length:204 start_codon:yes stop_codon:yes gene_type:complete